MRVADINSFLAQWIRAEGVQPPLLLVSTDERALAEAVTTAGQLLACEKIDISIYRNESRPCQTCRGCRQVQAGTYPDIVRLTAAKPPLLSMKDTRALLAKLASQSFHGRRLAIIPDAEYLSLPAIAALLKTLEEPAADTRFILTTVNRRRVLPTIVSRCQVVRLPHHQKDNAGTWPAFRASPETLSADDLAAIAHHLEQRLKAGELSPNIFRAYLRLRDYYKITSRKGNTKLATAVLLSTLEQIK